MSVNLFIILMNVIMILLCIVIAYRYKYYKNIYNKNASKKYFDINKECNINFAEKYRNLANKHNGYAKTYIYTYICILAILGIPGGIIIGKIYVCFISIAVLLITILTPIKEKDGSIEKNRETNAKEEKEELKEKYYNLIINDIIIDRLKGQRLIDYSTVNYDIKDEKLEYKQEKKIEETLLEIFKKTNRKKFEMFDVALSIDLKVNNQIIKLSRVTNSKIVEQNKNALEFRTKRIYSFIGYLIEIPNFSKLEKLSNIDKNDYILDDKNNTLYLLISDQINSSCFSFQQDRFMPKLHLKFEKEKFLEKNYIFFEELYKFISSLV